MTKSDDRSDMVRMAQAVLAMTDAMKGMSACVHTYEGMFTDDERDMIAKVNNMMYEKSLTMTREVMELVAGKEEERKDPRRG